MIIQENISELKLFKNLSELIKFVENLKKRENS